MRLGNLFLIGASGMVAISAAPRGTVAADPAPQEQWIVVVAPDFRDAVMPLAEHRRAEGMKVVVLTTTEIVKNSLGSVEAPAEIQARVADLVAEWPGRSYVLLLGAPTPQGLTDSARQMVPASQAIFGRMRGQPTDNGYGRPDKELLPSVAVGRMPARTLEEARVMVEKTIRGEHSIAGGWRYRLTFLAGSPSYYAALDKTIESLAMSTLERLSPGWSLCAVYYNANSSYTLPDDRIARQARDYLAAGQAVVVYEGHSGPDGFWRGPNKQLLFPREDWSTLDTGGSPCLFCTFGCNGAQLCGQDGEGYGVYAIRNPRGPVAVVGAHCVDDAAMSLLISNGLMQVLPGDHRPQRVGELWLGMLKNVAKGYINPILHRMLDEVDGDPTMPHDIQRKMHLEMFVLLGDPAFQMPSIGHRLEIEAQGDPAPGARLVVKAMVPDALEGAAGRLVLERAATDPPVGLKTVPAPGSPDRDGILAHNHRVSNAIELAALPVRVERGAIEANITLPADCTWNRLVLRLYVHTDKSDGMGARMIKVRQRASKPAETSAAPG